MTNKRKCQTKGCNCRAEADDDFCLGCLQDTSHRALWGSGLPMGWHKPS